MIEKKSLSKEGIPYTQVANGVLYSKKLSLKAKGMYAYLYSKPANWDFAATRIALEMKESTRSIQSALQELESVGLLTRERLPSGRVSYYLSLPDPKLQNDVLAQCKNSKVQKPHRAETQLVSNTDLKKDLYISKTDIYTPKEINQDFFDQGETYQSLLNEFSQGNDQETMNKEFQKFWLYWTEKNSTGKKQLWETKKTFEVKRRLTTWMLNTRNFNKPTFTKSTGITI